MSRSGHHATERSPVASGLRLGSRAVVALLSVSALAVSGYAWASWNDFTSNITRVSAIGGGPTEDGHKVPDVDGKDQNILIVGNDDRSTATDAELGQLGTTRDGGSINTDTMMVLHVPANGRKAIVIGIPRDSYVAIPGHDMNKINSAYKDGYVENHNDKNAASRLAVETVQNLTGLTIDHFVQVDLIGFYRISLAIKGVSVNLCNAVKEPESGVDLPKGVSTIQGKQALAFVRQRYGFPDGMGDLDRIKRQQYFLSAAFRKISSSGTLLDVFKLRNLLKAVRSSLTMDEHLDPLTLAEQMQDLTAGNLSFTTIPTDGFHTYDGVGSTVVVHPDQVRAAVAALIRQTAKPAAGGASGHKAPPTGSTRSSSSSGASSGSASGTASGSAGTTTAQQAGKSCID
jgi:LCP family protein required for cell wall assembly